MLRAAIERSDIALTFIEIYCQQIESPCSIWVGAFHNHYFHNYCYGLCHSNRLEVD